MFIILATDRVPPPLVWHLAEGWISYAGHRNTAQVFGKTACLATPMVLLRFLDYVPEEPDGSEDLENFMYLCQPLTKSDSGGSGPELTTYSAATVYGAKRRATQPHARR